MTSVSPENNWGDLLEDVRSLLASGATLLDAVRLVTVRDFEGVTPENAQAQIENVGFYLAALSGDPDACQVAAVKAAAFDDENQQIIEMILDHFKIDADVRKLVRAFAMGLHGAFVEYKLANESREAIQEILVEMRFAQLSYYQVQAMAIILGLSGR